MVRGLIAGETDYSNQTFEEMISDLEKWVFSLRDVHEIFKHLTQPLIKNGYWNVVTSTFGYSFDYAEHFISTCFSEITEILSEMNTKVLPSHITRLKSLAKTAIKLKSRLNSDWLDDKWFLQQDHDDENFKIAATLYNEISSLVGDLVDLFNIADRLKDFTEISELSNDATIKTENNYIDPSTLKNLRLINSVEFDLRKLIKLCEEINSNYLIGNDYSIAMNCRAILDHVPPIFKCKTFSEVYNNSPCPQSFKKAMKALDEQSRNIADFFLHSQVRDKEMLPNRTLVDYRSLLDLLLQEIVRTLS